MSAPSAHSARLILALSGVVRRCRVQGGDSGGGRGRPHRAVHWHSPGVAHHVTDTALLALGIIVTWRHCHRGYTTHAAIAASRRDVGVGAGIGRREAVQTRSRSTLARAARSEKRAASASRALAAEQAGRARPYPAEPWGKGRAERSRAQCRRTDSPTHNQPAPFPHPHPRFLPHSISFAHLRVPVRTPLPLAPPPLKLTKRKIHLSVQPYPSLALSACIPSSLNSYSSTLTRFLDCMITIRNCYFFNLIMHANFVWLFKNSNKRLSW